MLEIYDPIYSVSINGGPFKQVAGLFDTDWFASDEDLPETKLLLNGASFQEAYDYLRDNYVSGARTCKTIFRGRPQISLRYGPKYEPTYVTEKKCRTLSLRVEIKLRAGVTMEWIMKCLPADKAIQYFTERGLSIKK